MARTSATISVGADTRQLERDIQSALARDFKFKGLNEKAFSQPLGRITGAANEFQKSLDASNARVIAFGASAGLIYTVEKAFSSLVKSTIDVQKSLTDINVILNVSAKSLNNFGSGLFDIARSTGQSFDAVAQAATEFSRQGLGLEATLKRTKDALILTRLSGLDTVASVEALTATINSFSNAALDSTTIINKLANVDAAFAVSSADLAEAIKRVGSSAQDVGVDFDELLAIVTSVQQTTARGGAVIGNSLKTIFTRIQRTETLDQLEELGIKVRTLEGSTLPAIQVLSNLAGTFNTLGDSQKAQVAETVGGVFQINILKAALADLGKEYSVYNNALRTSSSSTNEAITRNEALNQTLSSLINKTFVNLTKVGSDFGKISFGPTIENLLNLLNKGLESIDVEGGGIGSRIAKSIFEQIGAFVSGPGVVLLTAIVTKLVFNLGKFAAQSLQVLLNLNTKAEERVAIQTKINQVLSQEPALVQAVYNKEISVLDVENKILNIIRQQTIEREKSASLSTAIAGGLVAKGLTSKGGTLKAKSAGFVPNFASSEILGALAGGYSPGYIRKMNIPGEGSVVYNSAEKVKKFPGMSQPAIMPPAKSRAGKNYQNEFNSVYGFNPYASSGFIPNFATGPAGIIRSAGIKSLEDAQKYLISGTKSYKINGETISQAQLQGVLNRTPRGQSAGVKPLDVSSIASVLLPFIGSSRKLVGPFSPKGKSSEFAITNIPVYGMKKDALEGDLADDKRRLFTNITNSILDNTSGFIDTLKPLGRTVNKGTLANAFSSSGEKGAYGAVRGAVGSAFEVGVKTALNYTALDSQKGFGDFDVRGGRNLRNLQKLFGFSTILGDFKGSLSNDNLQSFAGKIYKEVGMAQFGKFSTAKGKKASEGFVPNFTALNDAIGREASAGTPASKIRVGKDSRLTSAMNPLGLGVYNTKDEPLGLSQGVSRSGRKAKTAGASNGFVPNFAGPLLAAGAIAGSSAARFVVQQAVMAAIIYGINKLVDTVNSRIESEKNKQIVSTVGQAAQFGIGAGSLGGGLKGGIGIGLATLIPGLINALSSVDQTTKDLIAASEDNKDKIEEFNSAFSSYSSNLEKLKDETISSTEKQKILSENNEQLSKILLNTPDQLRDNLKTALSGGDFEKITQALSQVQVALQVSAANTENLAKITQITSDKSLKPEEFNKLSTSILSLQNERGISVASSVMTNPEILKNFQKSLQAPPKILDISSRDLADEIYKKYGYRINMEGDTGYATKGTSSYFTRQEIDKKEIERLKSLVLPDVLARKTKELEQSNSNQLINSIENLLKDSQLSEPLIKSVIDPLRNVPFDEASKEIENLNKVLESLGLTVQKTDKGLQVILKYTREDILRRSSIAGDVSKNIDSANAFRKALDAEALTKYSADFLDKQKELNPNRIAAGKVLDAQEQIYSSILNETERRKVNAKFIEQTNNLHKKGVVDLDKFILAVQGSQEELVALNQRARGLMFAEDFRGARQSAREKRILGGETKLTDFSDSFFDEFDNRTEDSYRQVQLGAADTARTIKSEFNNAFLSFANGTETASDAFTRMANNVSDKIQQLALEFATNQIFGSLFGSTSNMFGGSGGGIGDFFGSLFKSKGGIIKGYSSGGNVTGGSGTKDDIPAMLSGGEYVIRKSAVKKYGSEYLQMLNQGKVKKKAYGGEASFQEENTFKNTYEPITIPETGQTIYRPKDGQSSTGLLSIQAIFDSSNPQNELRKQMEDRYYEEINRIDEYLKYVEDVRKQNAEAYNENQKLNKEIRDQYNRQKSAASRGAWMSFGLGLLGAGASQFSSMGGFKGVFGNQSKYGASAALGPGSAARQNYANSAPYRYSTPTPRANGGYMKKFAKGGSSEDNIPALLMDGEFVMRKEAVNSYGKRFFDDLNMGRVKKYANGGEVNNSNDSSTSNYSPTNNVSVVVNLNQDQNNQDNKGYKNENQEASSNEENKKIRELAVRVREQVMKVITEQQRPGGLLSSAIYRKIG
jgi:TP901 family phage tail tape measure protein